MSQDNITPGKSAIELGSDSAGGSKIDAAPLADKCDESRFRWQTEDQLRVWADAFSRTLQAGDLILLHGPMGVGKTTLVQMAAAACGCLDPVRSPTYALIHLYAGPLPILHADLYRTEGSPLAELDELLPGRLSFVEWPVDELAKAAEGRVATIRMEFLSPEPSDAPEPQARSLTLAWHPKSP